MANEWDQFPDAGGTAVAESFDQFPDAEKHDPFASFPDAQQPSGPTVGDVPAGALPNITALKAGRIESAGTDPAVTKFFETPIVPASVTKWANPLAMGTESLKRTFPDSTAVKIASGITEGGAEAVSGFTSPQNLAILPFAVEGAASKALGTVFAAQAATQFPAQWKAFNESKDPQEKAKIAMEVLAGLGIPLAAFLPGHGAARAGELPKVAEATRTSVVGDTTPVSDVQSVGTGDVPIAPSDNPAMARFSPAGDTGTVASTESSTGTPVPQPKITTPVVEPSIKEIQGLKAGQNNVWQERLFPHDDLNARSGDDEPVSSNDVKGVKKTTNDLGQTVYAIRYGENGEFLGYSDNPIWELHENYGKGFGEPPSVPDAPLAATQGEFPPKANPESDTGLVRPTGQMEQTPTSTDPQITGVAQRINEQRAKDGVIGDVAPGEGWNRQEAVQAGRDAIAKGADPAPIAEKVVSGAPISPEEFSVLRAHSEDLGRQTQTLLDDYNANPNDIIKKARYETAKAQETKFLQDVIKPVSTEAHKMFMAHQGAVDISTGDFTDLRGAFTYERKVPPNHVEVQALKTKAKMIDSAVKQRSRAVDALGNEITRQAPNTLPKLKSMADLRDMVAQKLKEVAPCEI